MKKEDFCKKYNLSEAQYYGKEKIEGGLYLDTITEIPAGFNPTVGGDLYLHSVTEIPAGWSPTVGGDLFTRDLPSTKTPLPENYVFNWGGPLS